MAAGWVPSDTCAALPGVGGMGHHYVNPVQIMLPLDVNRPSTLLYADDGPGHRRLTGVEWFQPDAVGSRPTRTAPA